MDKREKALSVEKNHALGKIRLDIFEKYSEELYEQKGKLQEKLSEYN